VTGEIEQPHLRPWATVLRVPTPDGTAWFKASREAFAFEAGLLEVLGPLAPDLLPEVLAWQAGTGWLLLADAGARAREQPIAWAPLLRRYAELQLAAVPSLDRLLELGVPDRRSPAADIRGLLPALQPATAAALEPRLAEVEALATALDGEGLAPTIDHGDLHDGNVFSSGGQPRILDWGDACIAHPFLTLSVEMDPGARADYLEPFGAVASQAEIDRALDAVLGLRMLARAVNVARVLPYAGEEWTSEIEQRVALFLAGR
jgi:hypothetical protein